MRLEMPLWVLVGMSEVEGKPLGRGPSTVFGCRNGAKTR